VLSRSTAGAGRAGRRPAIVGAAAALLAVYGALSLLGGLQDGLDPLPAVGGAVLLLTAAGLLWGGRAGYWLGLAVTATLTVLVVQALVRRPQAALGVATAMVAVPLLLLAVPAARRPTPSSSPPSPEPAAAAATPAPEPQGRRSPGWVEERRGWGGVAAVVLLGLFLLAGGLGMAQGGHGSQRGLGASLALFGLAGIVACPTVAPRRRRGQLTLQTLAVGGRQETGVAFPYSSAIVAASLAGLLLMGLAMLGIAVAADPPLLIRVLGLVGAALVLVVAAVVGRGAGRRWRVVLTPAAVVYAPGEVAVVVPWAAITEVTGLAATYFTGGAVARERFVRLAVRDPSAVQHRRRARRLLGGRGDDLRLPVNALDVAPALLFGALRYYHRHPAARQELTSPAGLERVRRARFGEAIGDTADHPSPSSPP
jgi:hypothetical protein